MKWYSTKKYTPAIYDCVYFVRLSCREIFVATAEGKRCISWVTKDGKYIEDGDVTHFCIPDPVEIED